jgi:hypothetical protein
MIQVFQARELQSPFGKLEGWDWSKYRKVADVNITDEDYADTFRLTNNIEHSWIENEEVIPATENMQLGRGFRSTSIGDIIVLSTGKMLQCVSDGWNLIGFVVVPIEGEEADDYPEDTWTLPLSREECEERYGPVIDEDQVYYDLGFKH